MSDNRKYPAHSTAKPSAAQTDYHRGLGHVFYLIGAVCICVVLSAGIMFGGNALTADKVSINAAVIDTSTPFQPITNTPKPTVTPLDTHTPYPTFTHTPAPPTPTAEPDVVYVEIVVTVISERIITATMLPDTPTDTPVDTPEPSPTSAETAQGVIAQRNKNLQNTAGTIFVFGLSIAASIVLIAFALQASVKMLLMPFAKWYQRKTERVETPAPQARQIPVNDWKDELRRQKIVRMHNTGFSQRSIEESVFGYTGGNAHEFVKSVIEQLPHPTPPPIEDTAT